VRGIVTQGGRKDSTRPNVELVTTDTTSYDPSVRILNPPRGDYSSEFIKRFSIRYKRENVELDGNPICSNTTVFTWLGGSYVF
jgi:hypothetical protein